MKKIIRYFKEHTLDLFFVMLVLLMAIKVTKLSNGNSLYGTVYILCDLCFLFVLFIKSIKIRTWILFIAFIVYYPFAFPLKQNTLAILDILPFLSTFVALALKQFYPSMLLGISLPIYIFISAQYHQIIISPIYLLQSIVFILIISYVFSSNNLLRIGNHELTKIAYSDGLTRLPNRLYLSREVSLLPSTSYLLALINIVKFREINESFGYAFGDELLIKIGKRLQSLVSKDTLVGRGSGDEFYIILKETSPYNISTLLKELDEVFHIQNTDIFINTYCGITSFPADGEDITELILNAELALIESKKQGPNSSFTYNHVLKNTHERKIQIEKDLFTAIIENQFVLFFEPQIQNKTKKIVGAEVLIRWNNPTLGMVSPAEFIPILESTKQIIPVGEWILKESFNTLQKIQSENFSLSINISPIQLYSNNFVPFVRQQIQQFNINPKQLILEITEQHAIYNIHSITNKLQELRQIGIRISLDDFGTGYSSLSQLQKLPIDEIKIAQEFIRNRTKQESEPFINLITNIAEELSATVVVEGVETVEHIILLSTKNVHTLQGYYFYKPIPLNQLFTIISIQS